MSKANVEFYKKIPCTQTYSFILSKKGILSSLGCLRNMIWHWFCNPWEKKPWLDASIFQNILYVQSCLSYSMKNQIAKMAGAFSISWATKMLYAKCSVYLVSSSHAAFCFSLISWFTASLYVLVRFT